MFSSEQQVGKGEYTYGWYSASGGRMHGHQERLGFIAVSIFSWSYFMSEHLLTRYKFIPIHLSIKIIKDPTHTKEPQVNYSSSSIIM